MCGCESLQMGILCDKITNTFYNAKNKGINFHNKNGPLPNSKAFSIASFSVVSNDNKKNTHSKQIETINRALTIKNGMQKCGEYGSFSICFLFSSYETSFQIWAK